MSDEYINNKIETKAADSSSGSYAPPVESGKSRELSEPLPSTDILDFDL